MPRPAHRPPRQARSRESLRRMLDAAEVVLAKHGLDGATLPRIAAEADLSPANVYRRFRDKDALMRAVFTRISERGAQALEQQVDPEAIRTIGVRAFARQWVNALLTSFRANKGLMRATITYSRQHADAAFVRQQRKVEAQNFRRAVSLFLLWKDDIGHPYPELAVGYGMVVVAQALIELIVFDHASMLREAIPLSDERLREEMPRLLLRFWGVAGE